MEIYLCIWLQYTREDIKRHLHDLKTRVSEKEWRTIVDIALASLSFSTAVNRFIMINATQRTSSMYRKLAHQPWSSMLRYCNRRIA